MQNRGQSRLRLKAFWHENLRRMVSDWESVELMGGFFVLFVSAAGYGALVNNEQLAWVGTTAAVAYIVLHLLMFGPVKMWSESQDRIESLEGRLKPRLRLVFHPDRLPYLQEFRVEEVGHVVKHRLFRVGIQNDSDVVIRNVRVVLESFTQILANDETFPASVESHVLIEHALNVMGLGRKSGLVDVAPGRGPTAFVDVVDQTSYDTNPHGDWMCIEYATNIRTSIFSRGTYRLTLRVEGGGTSSVQAFDVGATLQKRPIEMRPCGIS
jgi:hypothetical protein